MQVLSGLAMALVLGLSAYSALAADGGVEARLNQVMANAQTRGATAALGKRAAFFCENCHGADGNSPLDHVPNLAGQNAFYLLTQIDKFGDGRRQDEFMSGLVKVLKPEDRFNIAVFYATQSVSPAPVKDARQVKAGQDHYMRACRGCHGKDARGNREIARLAGQQAVYLMNALKGYRAAKGLRSDPRMTGVAKTLDEAQIQALAAYLSTLR